MNKDQERLWDEYYKAGKEYNQLTPKVMGELLRSTKKQPSEMRCLDIGCGKGELVFTLSKLGVPCDGIDISSLAVKDAQKKNPQANIYHIDIENDFVFSDKHKKEYDLIFVTLVFAFIREKKNFLETCKKMLKADGRLIIYTPIWNSQIQTTRPGISINEDEFLPMAKSIFPSVEIIEELKREFSVSKTYILK